MLKTDASDVATGVVWTSKESSRHYARVDEHFVFRLGSLLRDGCKHFIRKLRCIRRRLCDYLSERKSQKKCQLDVRNVSWTSKMSKMSHQIRGYKSRHETRKRRLILNSSGHTCIWLGISQISRVATPPTMFKYKGNNLATSKIVAKEHKITQFHTSI